MTINVADGNPPVNETDLKTPVPMPIMAKARPVPPAPLEPWGQPLDLEERIGARRAEMIAKLGEIKTDVRIEAVEARDKLKAKLSELAHILKEGVVDGWANLGEAAKLKLEHWLAD